MISQTPHQAQRETISETDLDPTSHTQLSSEQFADYIRRGSGTCSYHCGLNEQKHVGMRVRVHAYNTHARAPSCHCILGLCYAAQFSQFILRPSFLLRPLDGGISQRYHEECVLEYKKESRGKGTGLRAIF